METKQRVFIALGANLGNRVELLVRACDALRAHYGVVRISRFYETEPEGCPEGSPAFLNACVELHTAESASEVLRICQAIETELGRVRSGIYGEARSCDLDIISYGDVISHDSTLTLPHPRAAQRSFVLQPLCDLDAELILPGHTQTISSRLLTLFDNNAPRPHIFHPS